MGRCDCLYDKLIYTPFGLVLTYNQFRSVIPVNIIQPTGNENT